MTRYITVAEYFWLGEQVTGVDADTLAKASRSELADSALHAPQADLNDGIWEPDPPGTDQAEEAMFAIAAGEVDETWTANWLKERVRLGEST